MGKILVISFMTYAELIRWALEANWGKNRQDRLEQYVRNYVIYPFDRALCIKWAEITDECRRKGITLGCADGWIAATAMQINIPLITNNAKDYQGIDGLTVITEIED
jgi:predicted nucleic acid-binding protein